MCPSRKRHLPQTSFLAKIARVGKEDFSKALSVFQNSCKALQKANLAINLHGHHRT